MRTPQGRDTTKRPTIRDVAAHAKVSTMTVSRVVNGSSLVTSDTRRAVENAIQALDYQPDGIARSMRIQRTRSIGFILPDLTNITNATVAQAIESEIMSSGYQLLTVSTQYRRDKEIAALRLMKKQRVEAVVLLLNDETDSGVLAEIEALGVRALMLDRDVPISADAVVSTHYEPMADAIRYLLGLGHQRIAAVLPPTTIRAGRLRRQAYVETMEAAGLAYAEVLVAHGNSLINEGRELTLQILSKTPRPTALILGTNQLTLGAMQAVRELDLRIPDDLSVIGSDDIVTTALLTPPLTILWRDMAAFGREAARILIDGLTQISGQQMRRVTMSTELLLRRSCTAPSKTF